MSEDAAAPQDAASGNSGLAAGLALNAARNDPALHDDLAAFLKDQRAMLRLQMEEMRTEEPYKLSHHRLRRFSGWAKATFEFSLGLLVLALVAGISLMVWNAAHSKGLVVESFSVPPDLAARGLTGEVVAGQLLDKVRTSLDGGVNVNFVNQGQTVTGAWTGDIKVEIPDTGISLGELFRFLRKWLGHETMIGGEVVHTKEGLAVTVRAGASNGATFAGPDDGFDQIIAKAAEHVAELTDPIHYAGHLEGMVVPRHTEGQAILERVINDPAATPLLKGQAWNDLAIANSQFRGDDRAAVTMLRRAREAAPTYALGYTNAVGVEYRLSHPEALLAILPDAFRVLENNTDEWIPSVRSATAANIRAQGAAAKGDFTQAAQLGRTAADKSRAAAAVGRFMALQHDGAARAWMEQQPLPAGNFPKQNRLISRLQIDAALEHWPSVLAGEAATEQAITKTLGVDYSQRFSTGLRPWLALAKAKTGDIAGGEAVIARTPGDCYDCIRVRGMIASEAKQWGQADSWFAKAVQDAPSIPMAFADWGQSLLARGKPDAAIGKFKLSSEKGPHFADPLEGWGEALMAKNQSHLALAKFAEAEKYAPNWGRLHLKWGEALMYAGKPADAKAQFARAAALDLTPSEKSELAKMP